MDTSAQIFLLGDQVYPYSAGLTRLLKAKDNVVLKDFLDQAFFAIRQEIGTLNNNYSSLFPRFISIIDLLSRCRDSATYRNNPALSSAFCCLHQLACFISRYSRGDSPYPQASNSRAVGFCTGLLAAAAISSCSSIAELVPLAVETVVLAFRTGLRTLEVRNRLQKYAQSTDCWSFAAPLGEEDATKLLDNFPSTGLSKPYISAVTSHNVTFSGPPEALQAFLAETGISSARVSVFSPYHADHLYEDRDVDELLEKTSGDVFSKRSPQMPVHCNSTGELFEASNLEQLLKAVLKDILRNHLRLDKIHEGLANSLEPLELSSCSIIPVAANGTTGLCSALKSRGVAKEVTVEEELSHAKTGLNGKSAGRPDEAKIAVVGYGGRFPESDSPDEFWDVLFHGLDVHKEIPPDRFDVNKHYDPTGKKKNTSKVKFGNFVKNAGHFDARFFNMSPREATQCDPAQRLVLLAAYEALEMAGFVPDSSPSTQKDRVGIMLGTTSDDYREVNSGQNIDTYFIPGGNRAFFPGRINYFFKFSGPSYSVDTACSSSFASIHLACNALWRGDCDSAISGGTNILTNPDNFAGLDRGHFLSHTGNCNTFDDGASGYCRSDAIGVVVLKRLDDAIADNDPILATINGAATNHSAEAVSMTRPHAGAQEQVFTSILHSTDTDPSEISYIEMHGTGTQAGDASEMASVLATFNKDSLPRKLPLYLGSAKANIGHAESASGVASLIKTLLMLKHSTIPPHCGIKTKINRGFPKDLEQRNIHIAMRPTAWNAVSEVTGTRKAFLNNFSAAGGNTALLLEDYRPEQERVEVDPRPTHLVAVSAKSAQALKANVKALADYVGNQQDLCIGSLSYTTTARRMHHDYRVIFNVTDPSSMGTALQSASQLDDITPSSPTGPTVNFAFTGQGSHYFGMARQLLTYHQFSSDILRFDSLARKQGFPGIMDLIENPSNQEDVSKVAPSVTQLAVVSVEMALAKLWMSWGVKPNKVIGHSLGEYAALNVAGVLTDSETLSLVGLRARLLEEKCTQGTHAMLAIKCPIEALPKHLKDSDECEVACVNGPAAVVVSGTTDKVQKLSEKLNASGVKNTNVFVPYAFHSSQVDVILNDFEEAASGIVFKDPLIPVISPLLCRTLTSAEDFGNCETYLRRHCRETVDFVGALNESCSKEEPATWIEIGPHPVCTSFIKSTLDSKTVALPSLRRGEDATSTMTAGLSTLYLAGMSIDWMEFHHDFKQGLRVLSIPSYRWDYKNFWMAYNHAWCLTKGDAPTAAAQVEAPAPKSRLTTSVQYIVEEGIESGAAYAIAESDVADSELSALINGHKVNGTPLCPSSAYADMALTIGEYLKRSAPQNIQENFPAMEVMNMSADKPLIPNGKDSQLFRISGHAKWNEREVAIKIYSVDNNGKQTTAHATCTVRYENASSWVKEWKRMSHFVRLRMDCLRRDAVEGQNDYHRVKRAVFYKLFQTLVDYDKGFQGHEEAVINGEDLEASGTVRFQTTEKDGRFFLSPYWIDSVGQITGFVMNANDAVDSKSTVFINHGWETVKIAVQLSPAKTYNTYVKMSSVGERTYAGDVFIFDGEEIVGLYQGVRFQGIPRQMLDRVLPKPGAAKAAVPAAPAKKQSPVASKPKEASVPTQARANTGVIDKALGILAEEVGVSISELGDEQEMANFGVDSLLSLTVSGRLREELEIEVESTALAGCPTIAALKGILTPKIPVTMSVDSGMHQRPAQSSTASASSSEDGSDDGVTAASSQSSVGDSTPSKLDTVRSIVAEEVGVMPAELAENLPFTDLGMDSLMSLTVLSRFREEMGLEVSADFLSENPTMGSVRKALGPAQTAETLEVKVPPPATVAKAAEEASPTTPVVSAKVMPKATSVLLQGSSKTCTKSLFLFPDGSGSSASYSSLPQIDSQVAVYGLNCPFLKKPEDLHNVGLAELTAPYLDEIRRRQPQGPYFLAGWSAGGICALDAAQTLRRDGETVERLMLLDSPCPIGLEKLPPRLYEFLNKEGVFGGHTGTGGESAAPSWLLAHFLAFIDSLDNYDATPSTPATAPEKTFALWAKSGVCPVGTPRPEKRPDDPREMWWLLNDREDLGPNGWDGLVGGEERMTIEVLESANHFSMMRGDGAAGVSRFLKKAMA